MIAGRTLTRNSFENWNTELPGAPDTWTERLKNLTRAEETRKVERQLQHSFFPIIRQDTGNYFLILKKDLKKSGYYTAAPAAAKSLQSCPTLCDPMDCSPPGSSIHGIFQARTLEWVAIAFSTGYYAAAAAAKSLQSYLTLCDPIDVSPPGSPIPGILQARTLEWVAISFSNAWKWKVKVKSLSPVWLFRTPWAAAYQAPPPMGFSRREYYKFPQIISPQLRVFVRWHAYTLKLPESNYFTCTLSV